MSVQKHSNSTRGASLLNPTLVPETHALDEIYSQLDQPCCFMPYLYITVIIFTFCVQCFVLGLLGSLTRPNYVQKPQHNEGGLGERGRQHPPYALSMQGRRLTDTHTLRTHQGFYYLLGLHVDKLTIITRNSARATSTLIINSSTRHSARACASPTCCQPPLCCQLCQLELPER